jgi:hypothetical protein
MRPGQRVTRHNFLDFCCFRATMSRTHLFNLEIFVALIRLMRHSRDNNRVFAYIPSNDASPSCSFSRIVAGITFGMYIMLLTFTGPSEVLTTAAVPSQDFSSSSESEFPETATQIRTTGLWSALEPYSLGLRASSSSSACSAADREQSRAAPDDNMRSCCQKMRPVGLRWSFATCLNQYLLSVRVFVLSRIINFRVLYSTDCLLVLIQTRTSAFRSWIVQSCGVRAGALSV